MEYRKRMDASGLRPAELLILEDPELSEILRPLKANAGGDLRLETFNALLEGYLNELATQSCHLQGTSKVSQASYWVRSVTR